MPERILSCTPSLNRAAESGMVNLTLYGTPKQLVAKCRVGSELTRTKSFPMILKQECQNSFAVRHCSITPCLARRKA